MSIYAQQLTLQEFLDSRKEVGIGSNSAVFLGYRAAIEDIRDFVNREIRNASEQAEG